MTLYTHLSAILKLWSFSFSENLWQVTLFCHCAVVFINTARHTGNNVLWFRNDGGEMDTGVTKRDSLWEIVIFQWMAQFQETINQPINDHDLRVKFQWSSRREKEDLMRVMREMWHITHCGWQAVGGKIPTYSAQYAAVDPTHSIHFTWSKVLQMMTSAFVTFVTLVSTVTL